MSLDALSSGAGGGNQTAQSQDSAASATSGTGTKTINIGGNPNLTSGKLLPVFIVVGVLGFIYLARRGRGR